ncbi:MAG TPA: tetratricopeptide repeat protein [Thermoanaerobaculia bacterium]|nr:tetratricopeptide repeat protein [Thermoanaerobaculia bacterium]
MILERHYDEETLIALLESPDPAATARDRHLASCKSCSETLDSFRTMSEVLADAAVWDARELESEPVPETIATLRAFADTMAHQDATAEVLLQQLVAGPRETWRTTLAANPHYRTPGMVRKLIAATDRAIDTMPPDALELTSLATDIADHLDASAHGVEVVARLRGAAWRERGYVLFYVGEHMRALVAVDRAEEEFRRCTISEYEQARLQIIRSLTLRATEKLPDALVTAHSAAEMFALFGDTARMESAQSAEATAQFSQGNYRRALEIWVTIAERAGGDAERLSRILPNIATCYREIGDLAKALDYYSAAAAVWQELGNRPESARVRCNVARVLALSGRHDEALARLFEAKQEFVAAGLQGAAILSNLDIAELLLLRNRFADAYQLCHETIEALRAAGMPYTSRALTAVAYMQEAVAAAKATPVLARHVRNYIERLPTEPNLLFLPLPE